MSRYDRDGGRTRMMFGTVAKYRLKPGHEKQFMDEMGSFEGDPPAGWVYHTVFRSTHDPNELWLSVVFESEEAYRKSADSPQMDKEYRRMLEHMQAEPEWHDGHVIHEAMRQPAKS
ncbi:MAG: hypothetical protein E6I04_03120 [Chloroflexi bacterium]|nr:MAG: hypothetical protein E6I36_05550 [Chloroflexota bacterium]TMF99115.1 MAG: hypothetical protein E6I04_03120 [Chloroflexota bacterium]